MSRALILEGMGIIAAAAVSAALLAGCDNTPVPAPTSEVRPIPGTGLGFAPYVWRDADTDCQYLSTSSSNALTPRIAADGKTHMGCK